MRPPHRAAAAINPERAAMTRFVLLIAGLVLCAGTALAQQPGMPPPGMMPPQGSRMRYLGLSMMQELAATSPHRLREERPFPNCSALLT